MSAETRLQYHLKRVERLATRVCLRDRQEIKRLVLSAYEAGKRDERKRQREAAQ